ncbi:MAG: elongation factor G [Chloroflexi bacterium]|nr:elongation factor G [Chloroflexota bacterium]
MQTFSADRLRNVALLSHSGAGKTSLAEALLFTSGAIPRMGRVDDGNTVSDYEPEEAKRRGSIQLAVLPCPWRECKINLLDTPGYFDFIAEALSVLRVADAAVLVVAAKAGVEVGTEQMWQRVKALGLPCVIVVNKMDRENADFSAAVESIRNLLGKHCVPVQLPIGAAQTFKGVVNLLPRPQTVPDEVAGQVKEAWERVVEAVAETDDDLATKYLEGETITDDELSKHLKKAVLAGTVVPVLAASGLQNLGTKELLDTIIDLLPSPAVARTAIVAAQTDGQQPLTPDPDGPLAALVFKTTADPFVGRLTLFRVYSGTIRTNSEAYDANTGQTERIAQLFVLRGKSQEAVPSLAAGDIGAVAKLQGTATGHTLTNKERPVRLEGISFPAPVYSMAVYPKTKADMDKLSIALHRLVEEDPSLKFTHDADTGEAVLQGQGDAHVDVMVQRAQRKFGVALVLQTPRIPYRETVRSQTSVEHRYKKQSGGHGNFAHIVIRLEPLPRGSGLEFASEVVGGVVPKEFIPAVEKGVRRACQEGVLAGYPVVDLRVVLYDGSYHPVDSAGGDFETAGHFGLKKGVLQGEPALLEPIMRLKAAVPDTYAGDIIGDLNGRRGRILGMNPTGDGQTEVEAQVPLAEMQRYALDLRAKTQGRGTFSLEFGHYEEVPPYQAQQVLEQAKQAAKA